MHKEIDLDDPDRYKKLDARSTINMPLAWWSICGFLLICFLVGTGKFVSSASKETLVGLMGLAGIVLMCVGTGWLLRAGYAAYIYRKYPDLKS